MCPKRVVGNEKKRKRYFDEAFRYWNGKYRDAITVCIILCKLNNERENYLGWDIHCEVTYS